MERENCHFLNDTIRNTMKILEVLSQNFPQPVKPEDIAEATDISIEFVRICLINLAFDEYVRETDQGYQQISLTVEKLNPKRYKILDGWFRDINEPIARRRDRNGEWLD